MGAVDGVSVDVRAPPTDSTLVDSALAPATSRAPQEGDGHRDERSDSDTPAALTPAARWEFRGDGGHLSSVRHDGRLPHRLSGRDTRAELASALSTEQ